MRRSSLLKVASAAAAVTLLAGACGGGGGSAAPTDTGGGGGGGGGGDQTLKIGYVLPETGSLAVLGPPQIQAVKFAISKINDAGGVLGNKVPDPVGGDEADDQAVAAQSADRVLAAGVNVIIGAAASGMSLAIIDKITGAGVAQCSGSNTAPTFTDYNDNGLYFRTAPSDALQGPVLADVIVGDGHSNVAIVARADDYGKGLADATAKALEAAGATVALNETYDTKATNFDATVQKITSVKPDAAVVIAFEEGKQIIKGLIEKGYGPNKIGVYGADGMRIEGLGALVDPSNPGVIAGMKGTAPASADNPTFTKELQAFAPDLKEMQFAPQVYDCVNIMALAAEQAKSVDANDFKDKVDALTRSDNGEKCTDFASCKALIDEGKDIYYEGASGALNFTDAGEPSTATIEIYEYNKKGDFESIGTREAKVATS